MRVVVATYWLTVAAAMPAAASPAMLNRAQAQPSPSIILLVEPGAAGPARAPAHAGALDGTTRISPSVIAMGEPGVEATTVASITPREKPPRNPHLPPMVIRGGFSGEAFIRGNGMSATAADPAAAQPPASPHHASGPQGDPGPPPAPPPGPVRAPQ